RVEAADVRCLPMVAGGVVGDGIDVKRLVLDGGEIVMVGELVGGGGDDGHAVLVGEIDRRARRGRVVVASQRGGDEGGPRPDGEDDAPRELVRVHDEAVPDAHG